MARFVCPQCGYKFWVKPSDSFRSCSACGYYFDYLQKYKNCSVLQLKAMKNELIRIRSVVCAVFEQDTTKKGLHGHCVITNQGLLIEFFEKFEYGLAANKKWTFRENPKYMIRYEDITAIRRGVFKGRPASFYVYQTKRLGALPLCFNVDAGITDKYPNIDGDIKAYVDQFRS